MQSRHPQYAVGWVEEASYHGMALSCAEDGSGRYLYLCYDMPGSY